MAYGVNRRGPGASVAPKIQSTSMAPRQAAMQRALQKPKPNNNSGGKGGGKNKGRNQQVNVNTQFGLNQSNPNWGTGADKYIKNLGPTPAMADMNYLGNPVGDLPVAPTVNEYGTVIPPSQTPATSGLAGPAGFAGYAPVGTGDPKLDKYLAADDIFQGIIAELNRNRQMNDANLGYNQGNLNTDNETIKRRLAQKELEDNRLLDDDYAARGLMSSGLHAKADVDLGQSYNNQYTDLSTNLAREIQQLMADSQAQIAMDEATLRQAQQDAIARRAQEFGILGGPNNSTGGKGRNKKDDKKGGKGKKGGKH